MTLYFCFQVAKCEMSLEELKSAATEIKCLRPIQAAILNLFFFNLFFNNNNNIIHHLTKIKRGKTLQTDYNIASQ